MCWPRTCQTWDDRPGLGIERSPARVGAYRLVWRERPEVVHAEATGGQAPLEQFAAEIIRAEAVQNVDVASITHTGEGPNVQIVLIPHRALGGVSLVLIAGQDATRLLWAKVTDLSTHDEIDLGLVVAEISRGGDWLVALRAAITHELDREIAVTAKRGLLGRMRITCRIDAADRKRQFVIRVLEQANVPVPGHWHTSLRDSSELPWSAPPPVEAWRAGA